MQTLRTHDNRIKTRGTRRHGQEPGIQPAYRTIVSVVLKNLKTNHTENYQDKRSYQNQTGMDTQKMLMRKVRKLIDYINPETAEDNQQGNNELDKRRHADQAGIEGTESGITECRNRMKQC